MVSLSLNHDEKGNPMSFELKGKVEMEDARSITLRRKWHPENWQKEIAKIGASVFT